MWKNPFLIFTFVTSLFIFCALGFIQSSYFPRFLKQTVAAYIPEEIGIQADFADLSIKMFPPGVSIKKPILTFKKQNIAHLPEKSKVQAERVDLIFLPLQMFSGNIRIHKVIVYRGDLEFEIEAGFFSKKKSKKNRLSLTKWSDLFQIKAESVSLEESHLKIKLTELGFSLDLIADSIGIEKWLSSEGPGYSLSFKLRELRSEWPKKLKFPSFIDELQAQLKLSSSGLQIDSLRVKEKTLELKTNGFIKGNVLDPKELLSDLKINVQGDLNHLSKELPSGKFNFDGKGLGNLLKLEETLKIKGALGVQGLSYQGWSVDEFTCDGGVSFSPQGPEVSVRQGLLYSKVFNRERGVQPGWGGKIALREFKFNFLHIDEVSVPLNLDQVHLHWLTGAGFKSIYPLDFRATGDVVLNFKKGQKNQLWSIHSELKLKLINFQLDNQSYGQSKPLHKVLQVSELGLEGHVAIDPIGIKTQTLVLSLPHTRFQLNGGFDFKKGFDFFAEGPVNLADFKQIGEVDFLGEGNLKAHVYGDTSDVTIAFNPDFKEAYYLNLKLGNLKGPILYQTRSSQLVIQNVEVAKGKESSYKVDGVVDLAADSVRVNVEIQKGWIQDFIAVFENLTRSMSWFPQGLRGAVHGAVKITGGTALKNLEISSDIKGVNWEYGGEKFKTVSFGGGFNKGKYYLKDVQALKQNEVIRGHISIDQTQEMNWDFSSTGLKLNELNHVARLDVPLRGKVDFRTFGSGLLGSLQSKTEIFINDLFIRGDSMPPCKLEISSLNGVYKFWANFFEGRGFFELHYDTHVGARSSLVGTLKNFDFSPLLLLLNPKTIPDSSLRGVVSCTVDLNYKTGLFEQASGKLEMTEYVLQKNGVLFRLKEPVAIRLSNGDFPVAEVTLLGNEGQAQIFVKSSDRRLEGSISGEVGLNFLEFLTPLVTQAKGKARLDLIVLGTIKEPQFQGRINFEQGGFKAPSLESPFENISGQLQFKANKILVKELEADLAQGQITTQGEIQVFIDRFPSLSLHAELSGNKLKFYPFQYVKIFGEIHLSGSEFPYLIDGSIEVESALIKEKILAQNQSLGLKSAYYFPSFSSEPERQWAQFNLDIEVKAEKEVRVQNEFFDAELRGQVKVIRTLQTPRLLGKAEIIDGKLYFKDRVFQIQSGVVNFNNPTLINPEFNLSAVTEVGPTKIFLFVSGNSQNFKTEFNSNPSLPEPEILSLLALGMTSDEVKKVGVEDRSTMDKSGAASLLLHSMDFNRDVQNKTGFQIQLDESLSQQQGSSAFRPKNETDVGAAPKIVVKKKIGRQFEFSLGSTVGVGTSSEREVNAEFQVTPNFSVIGVWDSLDSSDAKNTTSYGLDLKLQKRFK